MYFVPIKLKIEYSLKHRRGLAIRVLRMRSQLIIPLYLADLVENQRTKKA